jgi:hypothetical protein
MGFGDFEELTGLQPAGACLRLLMNGFDFFHDYFGRFLSFRFIRPKVLHGHRPAYHYVHTPE